MKFETLAQYFTQIENTSSRLSITELLARLFTELDKSEIVYTSYLLQGRVTPLYVRTDFGVAEKMALKAVAKALHIDTVDLKKTMQEVGDIGSAISHYKKMQTSLYENELTVEQVYQRLLYMAKSTGPGSQELKIEALAGLIQELDPVSARYVVRIPLGAMRLGFSDMTVLDAFSWMISGDKSHRTHIEEAYHVRPDLGLIGSVLKTEGIAGLSKLTPTLFTPIIMMRAERLSSATEIIEKVGECAIEPKYDGFRLQIHFDRAKQETHLYSRNLDDVTYMYPDIVRGIKNEINANSVIIEGEAIGFDPKTQSFLPFQETVTRKRKYDIAKKSTEVPLKLFAFELLYADGVSTLHEPYITRRNELMRVIKTTGDISQDTILMAPEKVVTHAGEIDAMFDEAVTEGLEGIMAKRLHGIYQAGARGWNWIKFKRSYSSKIDDTIDCLVMGFDYGKGKRTQFGIGAFLVGVYDEKEDQFKTIAKIGTGLTDEEWRQLHARASAHITSHVPALYDVDHMMDVDQWVKPEIVVEIKADEITRSPVHTAGRVMRKTKSGNAMEVESAGYALRFPRLERFRDDKRPEDITTVQELVAIQSERV